MLEFDSFVYLDLQKSGSSFLRDKLNNIVDGEAIQTKKHAPLRKVTDKPKIMTIRHPIFYYYSLWSYGIDGRGGFYKNMLEHDADRSRSPLRATKRLFGISC